MTYNYKIIARIYGEGSKFTMATFLSLDARDGTAYMCTASA